MKFNIRIRRGIALGIDVNLCNILFYPLDWLVHYYFETWNIYFFIFYLLLFLYFIIIKDTMIGYESIGKKIMGLKIYQNGIQIKDKKILKKRSLANLCDLVFSSINALYGDGKTAGDEKYNTKIVSMKMRKEN